MTLIMIKAEGRRYKLTVEEQDRTVTFPEPLCLEDALIFGLALQKQLGLPDESVLVRVADIEANAGHSLAERRIMNYAKQHGVVRL